MFTALYNISASGFNNTYSFPTIYTFSAVVALLISIAIFASTNGTTSLVPLKLDLQLFDDGSAELNEQKISYFKAIIAELNEHLNERIQQADAIETTRAEVDLSRDQLTSIHTELRRSRIEKKDLRSKLSKTFADQDNELRQARQERRALEQSMNTALAAKSAERSALENDKERLTDKLSLMQGWVDRHNRKIEQASKEINAYKAVLCQAKADRIKLSRSLEDAVDRLKQTDIERKKLSQSYKELQLQCSMYRDEGAEVREQYEAELGSDYLREAKESREAVDKAIQLRSIAQNKLSDLTTQLQLAASRHTDATARLQQASELIAHLRVECDTQKKARDDLKQKAQAKRISLSTISRASTAKSSLKGSSKPKKGRKVAFSLPPSASSRGVFIDKENVACYQVVQSVC